MEGTGRAGVATRSSKVYGTPPLLLGSQEFHSANLQGTWARKDTGQRRKEAAPVSAESGLAAPSSVGLLLTRRWTWGYNAQAGRCGAKGAAPRALSPGPASPGNSPHGTSERPSSGDAAGSVLPTAWAPVEPGTAGRCVPRPPKEQTRTPRRLMGAPGHKVAGLSAPCASLPCWQGCRPAGWSSRGSHRGRGDASPWLRTVALTRRTGGGGARR